MTETVKKPKVRLGSNYWRLWVASVVSNLGDGIALIAYPWLASAVTRSPVLIALIAVAQRLPWLVFTLPAGVITDRVDRRKLMVAMDVSRTLITLVVAATVVAAASDLPSPEQVATGAVSAANLVVYGVLLGASLLFGFAEVLRDNAAQTFLPAIVEADQLERANGNMWGAEMVTNSFVGPPLGSLLARQLPIPSQESGLVQSVSLPSPHGVPGGASPPAWHAPITQSSCPLHTIPSSHTALVRHSTHAFRSSSQNGKLGSVQGSVPA